MVHVRRNTRRSKGRALAVLIVLALAGAACTGQDETTETTSTTVAPQTTAGPTVDLVPFSDHLFGVEGVAPEGWVDLAYGVLLRQGDPAEPAVFVQQAAPGATAAEVMASLVGQLELPGPPPAVGTLESGGLEWTLYDFETSSAQFGGAVLRADGAIAESDFGAFIVGLLVPPDEYDLLHAGVFLPAVEAFAPPAPLPSPAPDAAYLDAGLPIETRVEALLAEMTVQEKLGQMTQVEKNSIRSEDITLLGIGSVLSGGGGSPTVNTPESWTEMVGGFQERALATRLGIPLIYGIDAVHGHNNVKGATIFPHNVGLGAANDPELMRRIGEVTATEVAATGIHWNFAPTVAVPQDIRWGRTYEGYGESTDLVIDLSAAYLEGLQGDALSDPATVVATPKHFVGDGGTSWGSATTSDGQIDQGDTQVDEATLRSVHLRPYEEAIDRGARTIMVSYSSWNGTKVHGDGYLITDVLKGELGFDGLVLSDWQAIDQISDDYYEAIVTAINAGIDMNMVPYDYYRYLWLLSQAVESGDVSMERIDDAVRRVLRIKFEMGLFEAPHPDPGLLATVGSAEHRAVARDAVAKSAVLLKNDGGALPLADDLGVIFVGGQAADDIGIQSGGWTIEWQGREGAITEGTTILEGIQAAVGPDSTVLYDKFGRLDRAVDDDAGVEPDVCVGVVGERPYAEFMGDSADLAIVDRDLAVLDNLEQRCERLVVVLVSGRPVIISDRIDRWDAVVAAWLPGSEGQGVADVLFGLEPFQGTLPYTWPSSIDQVPLGALAESGSTPLFPFGYGLEN